ncbi:MAG: hypothetical protein LBF81_04300 [Prevotellaceae bacterium]|jgi:uncharacterized protein (TIGR02145 family)|nr:hypothetical protein [Prevotellaceae bacterium]
MKKILSSFLSLMGLSFAVFAQSHINIEMLSATYTAPPIVKFRISWSSVPTVTGQIHNAKVWVWVDFLKLNADNTTAGNTWTRAEISGTPAVSSSPTSTAALDASTNKGFWLNGVTGNYSATITATLSNIPANTKFNWCAYASDCQPNVTTANGTYTFKGTPPFTLIASNGVTTQTVSEKTLATSALTITPTTIRDKTECPGIFCPYQENDLFIDATHLCQRRQSGAQNWEAWIKDTRDGEYYRIVLMPDNKWWLAQNVKYAGKGYPAVGCTPDECGRAYPNADVLGGSSTGGNIQGICPAGWLLPVDNDWNTLISSIGDTPTAVIALRPPTSPCGTSTNQFGFADIKSVCFDQEPIGIVTVYFSQWYTWNGSTWAGYSIGSAATCNDCQLVATSYTARTDARHKRVRCFRQL